MIQPSESTSAQPSVDPSAKSLQPPRPFLWIQKRPLNGVILISLETTVKHGKSKKCPATWQHTLVSLSAQSEVTWEHQSPSHLQCSQGSRDAPHCDANNSPRCQQYRSPCSGQWEETLSLLQNSGELVRPPTIRSGYKTGPPPSLNVVPCRREGLVRPTTCLKQKCKSEVIKQACPCGIPHRSRMEKSQRTVVSCGWRGNR